MTINELCDYLNKGREIEFEMGNHQYFISPMFSGKQFLGKFIIYDSNTNRPIFSGPLNELLSFEFADGVSFQRAFDFFEITYIF